MHSRTIGEYSGHLYNSEVVRYGIEVELESVYCNDAEAVRMWDYKGDGSLRDGGMEFITPPLPFHAAYQAIHELYQAKVRYGWTGGRRCGTHVHVEVNQLTGVEVAAMVTAYLYVEPLMYHWVGADRDENIYCIPFYRAPQELMSLGSAWRSTPEMFPQLAGGMNKYCGLYLEPMCRFGTVEFRMPPVFDNAHVLQDFLLFVRKIREYAVGRNPLQVVAEYEALGGKALARKIFQGASDRLYGGDIQAVMDYYDVESWVEMFVQQTPDFREEWVTPTLRPSDHAIGIWRAAEGNIEPPPSPWVEEPYEDDEHYDYQ